jgi:PST family polysaccharide transporter
MAYTIYLIPVNDVGLVNTVMFSGFSRLQDDPHRFKRGLLLATRYVTIIGLPMMVGLSLVAPFVVEVFFGEKWLASAPVVSILAMAGFLQLILSLGPAALQGAGRADLRLRLSTLSMVLYLPAFALGLHWGISGVATGYLVATAIMTPVLYSYVARVVGVRPREMWEAIAPSLIGCAVMAGAVTGGRWAIGNVASLPKIVSLALLIILGIVVYGVVAWLIQRDVVLGLVRTVRDAVSGSKRRELTTAEEA